MDHHLPTHLRQESSTNFPPLARGDTHNSPPTKWEGIEGRATKALFAFFCQICSFCPLLNPPPRSGGGVGRVILPHAALRRGGGDDFVSYELGKIKPSFSSVKCGESFTTSLSAFGRGAPNSLPLARGDTHNLPSHEVGGD